MERLYQNLAGNLIFCFDNLHQFFVLYLKKLTCCFNRNSFSPSWIFTLCIFSFSQSQTEETRARRCYGRSFNSTSHLVKLKELNSSRQSQFVPVTRVRLAFNFSFLGYTPKPLSVSPMSTLCWCLAAPLKLTNTSTSWSFPLCSRAPCLQQKLCFSEAMAYSEGCFIFYLKPPLNLTLPISHLCDCSAFQIQPSKSSPT